MLSFNAVALGAATNKEVRDIKENSRNGDSSISSRIFLTGSLLLTTLLSSMILSVNDRQELVNGSWTRQSFKRG